MSKSTNIHVVLTLDGPCVVKQLGLQPIAGLNWNKLNPTTQEKPTVQYSQLNRECVLLYAASADKAVKLQYISHLKSAAEYQTCLTTSQSNCLNHNRFQVHAIVLCKAVYDLSAAQNIAAF